MDAGLGYLLINNPMLLHDTQHWFEFIQASVRSQFWQPDNVIQRVRPMVEHARQTWAGLPGLLEQGGCYLGAYLDALEIGCECGCLPHPRHAARAPFPYSISSEGRCRRARPAGCGPAGLDRFRAG